MKIRSSGLARGIRRRIQSLFDWVEAGNGNDLGPEPVAGADECKNGVQRRGYNSSADAAER